MKRYVLFLCVTAALGGCATQAPRPLMTHGDPAVEALNDSAQRIARAAEQAALAESVGRSGSRVTREYGIDLEALPPELRDPLLLEGGFHGELEVFLKSLTGAIGWADPVVYGARPAIPSMLTLTEQRRPPILWFADAGYQSGQGAEVIVDVKLRQVVLTYVRAGE